MEPGECWGSDLGAVESPFPVVVVVLLLVVGAPVEEEQVGLLVGNCISLWSPLGGCCGAAGPLLGPLTTSGSLFAVVATVADSFSDTLSLFIRKYKCKESRF